MPTDKFAITFPVRFVILNDRSDGSESAQLYYVEIDGKFCIPLFTDHDLMMRHFAENGGSGKTVALIQNPDQLREMLPRFLSAQISHVVFDPGKFGRRFPWVFDSTDLLDLLN
jgi:hypothetical protein